MKYWILMVVLVAGFESIAKAQTLPQPVVDNLIIFRGVLSVSADPRRGFTTRYEDHGLPSNRPYPALDAAEFYSGRATIPGITVGVVDTDTRWYDAADDQATRLPCQTEDSGAFYCIYGDPSADGRFPAGSTVTMWGLTRTYTNAWSDSRFEAFTVRDEGGNDRVAMTWTCKVQAVQADNSAIFGTTTVRTCDAGVVTLSYGAGGSTDRQYTQGDFNTQFLEAMALQFTSYDVMRKIVWPRGHVSKLLKGVAVRMNRGASQSGNNGLLTGDVYVGNNSRAPNAEITAHEWGHAVALRIQQPDGWAGSGIRIPGFATAYRCGFGWDRDQADWGSVALGEGLADFFVAALYVPRNHIRKVPSLAEGKTIRARNVWLNISLNDKLASEFFSDTLEPGPSTFCHFPPADGMELDGGVTTKQQASLSILNATSGLLNAWDRANVSPGDEVSVTLDNILNSLYQWQSVANPRGENSETWPTARDLTYQALLNSVEPLTRAQVNPNVVRPIAADALARFNTLMRYTCNEEPRFRGELLKNVCD